MCLLRICVCRLPVAGLAVSRLRTTIAQLTRSARWPGLTGLMAIDLAGDPSL